MANLPKRIEIDLDKPRSVFYDMKTSFQYEEEAKKGIRSFNIADQRDLCTMMHVILKREDPEITFDRVTELIHGGNLVDVQKALAEVMGLKLIFKQSEVKELSPEEAAKNSEAAPSGASGSDSPATSENQ